MHNFDSKPTVRPVVFEDLPALKAIVDATGLFPSELLDEMMVGYLDASVTSEFWLTTIDEENPVAIAYCAPERMTQGTWNLLLIAVTPARQGQGLGATLLHYVENLLATQGERLLLVETSGVLEFERTREFYRKNNYEEEARIRDYYEQGDDKIVFRKRLTKSLG